jgi:hypothetical protein
MVREYIPKGKRYKVFARQNWRCKECSKHIAWNTVQAEKYGYELGHLDHIHPVVAEDTYTGKNVNELDNLQALCWRCNLKKSGLVPQEIHPVERRGMTKEQIHAEIERAKDTADWLLSGVNVNSDDKVFSNALKLSQHLEDYAEKLSRYVE